MKNVHESAEGFEYERRQSSLKVQLPDDGDDCVGEAHLLSMQGS